MVHRLAQPDGWSADRNMRRSRKWAWAGPRVARSAEPPSWPGAPGGTSPDGSLAGGGGGGGGGLSYTDSPRVSDGQVINAKGYRGLGHTDGIVIIITPVFG